MSAKVTSSGVSKKNAVGAMTGSVVKTGGTGANKKDELAGTGKLRSQSTLKNQMMSSAQQVNTGSNPNSSLLNFTTQPYEQSKKRGNAQHSIIMAAVEGGKQSSQHN